MPVTIKIDGREVSFEEMKQTIDDKILASVIQRVRDAIGDLPIEIVLEGDLKNLNLNVEKCSDELKEELHRRLQQAGLASK